VTKAMMHQLGGLLVVQSARVGRQVFVSVLAYQPDRPDSNSELRQQVSRALGDFSLTASAGWGCPEPAIVTAAQADSFELNHLTT